MGRTKFHLLAMLMLLAPVGAAAVAAPEVAPAPGAAQYETAGNLIRDGKPEEAIALLDSIIAAEAARNAGERRRVYCAQTPEESLTYSLTAASENKAAVVLDPTWCMAIFLKGFALVDLRRPEEAGPLFEQALAMAPMNAQFLAELGEWHKQRREWAVAYPLFERAVDGALFSPADVRTLHKGRALRGMAFVLIEQGKLGEAERRLRECLELDPNDQAAKNELDYVRQQRRRQGST